MSIHPYRLARAVALSLSMVLAMAAGSASGAQGFFFRGDSNDDGGVDLSDAVYTLSFLYQGGPPPACADAADANDDGALDISDPISTLNYLFVTGIPLPPPGATVLGVDPTEDGLGCQRGEPSQPAKLGFLDAPPEVVAGEALPAVEVAVLDAAGTLVPTATNEVTLSLQPGPGGGALAEGTTVRAVNGIATFRDVRVLRAGPESRLVASGDGLAPAESSSFTVDAAAPLYVALVLPGESLHQGVAAGRYDEAVVGAPQSQTAGVPFDAPVGVFDAFFNRVAASRLPSGLRISVSSPTDTQAPAVAVVTFLAPPRFTNLLARGDERLTLLIENAGPLEPLDSHPFAVQPGATAGVVVLLPGQTLRSGVRPLVGGIPDLAALVAGEPFGGGAALAGERFRVEAYAVDAFGNIDFSIDDHLVLTGAEVLVPGTAVQAKSDPVAGTLVVVQGAFPPGDFAPGRLVLLGGSTGGERARVVGAEANVSITVDRLGSSYTKPLVTPLRVDLSRGEGRFALGQRFATVISRADAPTGIASASTLQVTIDATATALVTLDQLGSGAEIAGALQEQVRSQAAGDLQRGAFEARFLEDFHRYLLVSGAPPSAERPGTVETAGPGASLLDLDPPLDRFDSQLLAYADLEIAGGTPQKTRFSRGIAVFEIYHRAGATPLVVAVKEPQSSSPQPFPSSGFAVLDSGLLIRKVELYDSDANGRIDRAVVQFTDLIDSIDAAALPQASSFTLSRGAPGVQPASAGGTQVERTAPRRLEVKFGAGIPTTGLDGVSLEVKAGTLLPIVIAGVARTPVDLGPRAIDGSTLNSSGGAVLIDKAPPVLLGATAVDTNGDGAPDQLIFQFSEEVRFTPGRGAVIGTPKDAPARLQVGSTDTLLVGLDGGPVLTLSPPQPTVGATEIATSFQTAFDRAPPAGFGAGAAEFLFLPAGSDSGRFVIRSGSTGSGSSVLVAGGSASEKLGFGTGQIVRPGTDGDSPRIEDFLVLSSSGGVDLLAGMTDRDIVVDGNRLVLSLNNSPAGATGTPLFYYLDDLNGGFLSDQAGNEPGLLTNIPAVSAGDSSGFIKIRDTDSSPDDGVLAGNPRVVRLDPSPSLIDHQKIQKVQLDLLAIPGGGTVEVLAPSRLVGQGPGLDLFPGLSLDQPVELACLAASTAADPYLLRYTVTLTPEAARANLAVDSQGRLSRTFRIAVQDLPPVADLGFTQLVAAEGSAVTLDGTLSLDPNGGELLSTGRFAWTVEKPGGSTFTLAGATPSFTGDEVGAHRVSLQVTDSTGHPSEPAEAWVVVTGTQSGRFVPTADPGVDQVARVGQLVTLDGSASRDPEGGALLYQWSLVDGKGKLLEKAVFPVTAEAPSFTPSQPGVYNFQLQVTDPAGARRSDPSTVHVFVIDDARGRYLPSASVSVVAPSPDAPAHVFEPVTLTGGATAVASPVKEFRWTQVGGPTLDLEPLGSSLTFRPVLSGTYTFELTVTDQNGLSSFPRKRAVPVFPEGVSTATVDAGPDLTVTSSPFTLEGRQDFGQVKSTRHRWVQVAGPPTFFSADDDPAVCPARFSAAYSFEWRVVGPGGALVTGRRTVALSLPEEPLPVAVLQTTPLAGGGLRLDGAGSTPAGVRFSFQETEGLPTVLDPLDTAGSAVSFSPLVPGAYGFSLTVVDPSTRLRSAPASAAGATGFPGRLAVAVQPTDTTAGVAIAPPILVLVQDLFGNHVSQPATVTALIGQNPGGGTLSGITRMVAVDGEALFSDLRIDRPGAGYTLTFSSPGLVSATSAPFSVLPSSQGYLAIAVEPSSSLAGSVLDPPVKVEVQDPFGNRIPRSITLTATLAGGSADAVLSGTTRVVAVDGLAVFGDLSIDRAASGYSLSFSAEGFVGATSVSFDVVSDAATRLAIEVQPSSSPAGAAIRPPIQVAVLDRFGNRTPEETTVTATFGLNPSGATLSGTTRVVAAGGLALFADLSVDKAVTGYTLLFQSSGLQSAESVPFAISAASPARLSIRQQPPDAAAGSLLSPAPEVAIVDPFGNTCPVGATVTATLDQAPPGAALIGTPLVQASSGVAVFSDLRIERAASGYALAFSAEGLAGATSGPFRVAPGPAQSLQFLVQPSDAQAGSPIAPAVQVAVRDGFGNLADSAAATVTVALQSNPGGATLFGSTTAASAGGVASFPDLSLNRPGAGYTLAASSPGLTGAVSAPFTVDSEPPRLAELSVPAGALSGRVEVTFTLQDSTSDPVDVLLEIDSGSGLFSRATQAGSEPGSGYDGVQALATSPTGVTHTVLWNSSADLGRSDRDGVVLRVTPIGSLTGRAGAAGELGGLTVRNGLSFDPAAEIPFAGARFAVVGDFNRDGWPDLVAVGSQAFGPYLQDPAAPRSFIPGPLVSFPGGSAAVAGDFFMTGAPALAVAGSISNQVALFFNDGSAGFSQFGAFPVGAEPVALAAADLNTDGVLDLVAANHGSSSVSVLFLPVGGRPLQTLTFATGGAQPAGLAIGDFNQDGLLDLVVADAGSNDGSVLLGSASSGSWTLVSGPRLETGSAPVAVVAADFNHDGRPDLVVANAGSDSVSYFAGNGKGDFQTRLDTPAGSGSALTSAWGCDLDGDGFQDLLVGSQTLGVLALLGNGSGSFTVKPAGTTAPANVAMVAAADLDLDGRLDFLAPSTSANVVYLGYSSEPRLSDPSFPLAKVGAVGPSPRDLAVADFNGDGKLDLATASGSEATVSVLLGKGNGTVVTKSDVGLGSPARALIAADFNGDGRPDLAVALPDAGAVSVLLWEPAAGGFGPPRDTIAGAGTLALAAADLNRDGRADLVAVNAGSRDVAVLLGRGDGSFERSPITMTATPTAVVTGDLNGDGLPDLCVSSEAANLIAVGLGTGGGAFAAPFSPILTRTSPNFVLLGDVNQDGILDVITLSASDSRVSVLAGNGAGGFSEAPGNGFSTGEGPAGGVVVDLDGDGLPDLAVACAGSNELSVLLGTGGGGFAAARSLHTAAVPLRVAAADLNGDGRPDLVVSNQGSNSAWVFAADGKGWFVAAPDFGTGSQVAFLAAADLDRDGKPDVAICLPDANEVRVFRGHGDGTFQPAGSFAVGSEPVRLVAADFNSDGLLDLVTANKGSADLSVLLGHGSGDFTLLSSVPAGPAPIDLVAGDLDHDGKLDLAVVSSLGNSVTVLKGQGGSFFPTSSFATGEGPVAIAAGDLNRDGSLDLVVASAASKSLTVALHNGQGGFDALVPITLNTTPTAVFTGDTRRSGRLDLVVATSEGAVLLLGDGKGGLLPGGQVDTVEPGLMVFLNDADGDGKLDLALGGPSTVTILPGDGKGGFGDPVVLGNPSAITAGKPGDPLVRGGSGFGCAVARFAYLGGPWIQRAAALTTVFLPLALLAVIRRIERRRWKRARSAG
jgi:adhesin/invasin